MKRFDNAQFLGNLPTPNGWLGNGTAAVTHTTFYTPYYLGIDAVNGHLFVGDDYRVLLFQNAQLKSNSAPADLVLGQSSFTSSSITCDANTLNNAIEPYFDSQSGSLFVSDYYHHRQVSH